MFGRPMAEEMRARTMLMTRDTDFIELVRKILQKVAGCKVIPDEEPGTQSLPWRGSEILGSKMVVGLSST